MSAPPGADMWIGGCMLSCNRRCVVALLFFLSFCCQAQVANGDFSGGGSGWVWSQGYVPGNNPADCFPTMAGFLPSLTTDVYQVYSTGGRGRSAKVSGKSSTIPQRSIYSTYCRQISQVLQVPANSLLKFDSKLGIAALSYPWSPALSVNFTVSAVDNVSGTEIFFLRKIGNNFYCTPGQDCSAFLAESVDVSALWGRSVTLRFRTDVYYPVVDGSFLRDPEVFVDNIRFEQIPVAPWPTKSGSWYNPNRSGHGIHLSRAGNGNIMIIWYTYLADGRPVWYISDTVPVVNGVWQSGLYKSTWNAARGTNQITRVGDIKFEMTDQTAMTFYWDLYSINGGRPGFDGAEPFVFLSGGESYTGLWYEPAYSGWGMSIEYKNNSQGIDTVATAFYFDGTEPVWAQGAVEGPPAGNKLIELTSFTGFGLCPECIGQEIHKSPWPAGLMSLSLDTGKGWIEAESQSGSTWKRGSASQPAGIVQMTSP